VHARIKEFKSRKRFGVLKIVNRFSKIKEAFTVKLKMIFIDHYFRPHQTPKNAENIFKKTFTSDSSSQISRTIPHIHTSPFPKLLIFFT
jgi:hypothetical protein